MSGYKNGGVIILDFGSQYTQLIARKIRELNVFSHILPHDIPLDDIMVYEPKGIILSGGPSSVYEKNAPSYNKEILNIDLPILIGSIIVIGAGLYTFWRERSVNKYIE